MPNPFDGVGDFVGALLGGGQARETGYRNELNTVSTLDKKLAEAAMARDQARSLSALDAGAAGRLLGLGPEQADIAGDWSTVLHAGGGNAAVLAQALQRAHELGTRQNVQALATEPDSGYSPINAQLVGLANGPQQTSQISGNNLILDRFSDEPGVASTPAGEAMIAAANALTGQRNAAAAASAARADLAHRTDPNRSRKAADKPRSKDVGEQRKVVRGKTYVKRDGQWFEE